MRIYFFGETHIRWLKDYLALPHGIPSADTILRVLARIDSKKFEECFLILDEGYFTERAKPGSVIAIDGKTARGSASDAGTAMHLVSAWTDDMVLVLGQVQTEEKSNEITAIPQLLAALDIAGCVVTIDAMGCQKEIARNIMEQQGDYVVSLKGNHPETCREAEELFEESGLGEPEYSDITKDYEKRTKKPGSGITLKLSPQENMASTPKSITRSSVRRPAGRGQFKGANSHFRHYCT